MKYSALVNLVTRSHHMKSVISESKVLLFIGLGINQALL